MPRRPTVTPAVAAMLAVVIAACGAPVGSPASSEPADSTDPTSDPTAEPTSETPIDPAATLALEVVATGLESPVDVAFRPDDPDALFIAEQGGAVRIVRAGSLVAEPFLDIAGQVTAGGEQGFLGIAFHPEPDDRRLFTYYTALDGSQVVASFSTSPGDGDLADAGSETVLLRMDDPFGNHNGGALAFGPDGYLYIATGDGGGGGDPLDSGRRLDTLLAKILRIDVDQAVSDGLPYAIPPGNPFTDEPGARPEIWHTGLRNPWRMRFDRETGDLWIGDVGQSQWEEVDVARAGVAGLDFGWNLMEGTHCFAGDEPCAAPDLTLPVTEYGHDEGCSVVSGTVYRGDAHPSLQGTYLFADYCSGRMWTLDPVGDAPRAPTFAADSGRSISAIGEDAAGELFLTDRAAGELVGILAAD